VTNLKIFIDNRSHRAIYSDEYVICVYNTLGSHKVNSVGFYLQTENEYKDASFVCKPQENNPGNFLGFQKGFWYLINLNIPLRLLDTKNVTAKLYLNNTPFIYFINQQKKNGTYLSYEQSQVDFIKRYNLRYFIIKDKSVQIPDMIKQRISVEIADSKSGEVFYLLKDDV
jgi:hypothetical protein